MLSLILDMFSNLSQISTIYMGQRHKDLKILLV